MIFNKNIKLSYCDSDNKYFNVIYDNINLEDLELNLQVGQDPIIKKINIYKYDYNHHKEMDRYSLEICFFQDCTNEDFKKNEPVMKQLQEKYKSLTFHLPLIIISSQLSLENDSVDLGLSIKTGLLIRKDFKELLSIIQSQNKYITDEDINEFVYMSPYRAQSDDEIDFFNLLENNIKTLNKCSDEEKINDIINNLYSTAEKIDIDSNIEYFCTKKLADELAAIGIDDFAIAIYEKIPERTLYEDCSRVKIGNILYNQSLAYKDNDIKQYRELLKKSFKYLINHGEDEEIKLAIKILQLLGLGEDVVENVILDPVQLLLDFSDKSYELTIKYNELEKDYKALKEGCDHIKDSQENIHKNNKDNKAVQNQPF